MNLVPQNWWKVRTRRKASGSSCSLGADGEGDEGGVVACEEVLPAGFEPRPLISLRQLCEPRRLQLPLRLIFSHRKQQQETDSVQFSSRQLPTKERRRAVAGRVPTAWKAVGEALRKSMRSETTAAMGGGRVEVGTEYDRPEGRVLLLYLI